MRYDVRKIDRFPHQPGVYLMKGRNGQVLYVGKAKNLRQRVKQYFVPGRDERMKVPYLVARVYDIETIVVSSEKEALLLENTLIKEHQPRFNAIFKDDKSYISLKVTTQHEWPMVKLVRYKGKPKADGQYFGPYTSAYAARQTLDLLHKLFPLRQCSDNELRRRTRPCLLYDMKRCVAPCVERCTREEYDRHVRKTLQFLKGQDQEVLKELYSEMEEASQALEFERAAMILRSIRYIEATMEKQNVVKVSALDRDAWAVYREGEEVMVSQMIFRTGKLLGSKQHEFSDLAQDDDELLASLLLQQYEEGGAEIPDELLLPVEVEESQSIAEILSQRRGKSVAVHFPQRGEKLRLIELAATNAEAAYKKEKDARSVREKMLLEMQEKLHLRNYPARIECFDNSHTQGDQPVSSMVVFTDGLKDSKRYRLYKLRATEASDDYGAMHEVLLRRYRRAQAENDLPNLIIVDGGKGQLNIARKVLKELNIATVDVIGVAKEGARHDKGQTHEQIFLPNVRDPLRLSSTSPILFLLQKIRDEAHRRAITFHRKRRGKSVVASALDGIPGVGPAKKKALLKQFGSIKQIKAASKEALCEVPGVSESLAESIQNALRN